MPNKRLCTLSSSQDTLSKDIAIITINRIAIITINRIAIITINIIASITINRIASIIIAINLLYNRYGRLPTPDSGDFNGESGRI